MAHAPELLALAARPCPTHPWAESKCLLADGRPGCVECARAEVLADVAVAAGVALPAGDARHGTYAGYVAGCRITCCRTAAADYQRRRYFDHVVLGLPARHVDKTGTMRRVQALQRIGWSAEDLSVRVGRSRAYLNVAINRPTRRGVHQATADLVRRLYDDLSMTPGPSQITRRIAEKKGWAPPLAWDDDTIDDPAAQPSGVYEAPTTEAGRHAEARAQRVADLEHAIEHGHTLHRTCADLGITTSSLHRWCTRHGHSDLFEALSVRTRTASNADADRGAA